MNTVEPQEIQKEKRNIPFIFLLTFFFFLPIFFIPSTTIPFSMGKGVLVIIFATLIAIGWLVQTFRKGEIIVPKSWMFAAMGVLSVSVVISAFLSGAPRISFLGQFQVDTVISTISIFVILFVTAAVVKTLKQRSYLYGAIFAGLLITVLFQLVNLFTGPEILSFGVFLSNVSNVVGKWNDLAIFLGAGVLLLLFTVEFFPLTRKIRWFIYTFLIIILLLLLLIGFNIGWYILGAVALLYLVFKMAVIKTEKQVSVISLVIVALSLTIIFGGNIIGDTLSDYLNAAQVEVRPSFTTTSDISKEVVKNNKLFGFGPNRFDIAWTQNKPIEINLTSLWAVKFNGGISSLATSFVTLGIPGFIGWIAVLMLSIFSAFRLLFKSSDSQMSRYFGISASILSLYLWTFFIFYIPNLVILMFAALFTGLVLSSLSEGGHLPRWRYNFAEKSRTQFVTTLGMVVLVILIAVSGYISVVRFGSHVLYAQGVRAVNQDGDITEGERLLSRAIRLYESDQYYRTLSGIQTGQIGLLFNRQGVSEDVIRTQFQSLAGTAISNAQRATQLDSLNYINWSVLAQLYEQLVPLGIQGAYESANTAYARARVENPNGPDIVLSQARLEATRGDSAASKVLIKEALTLKPDYSDAVFLLSQIQVAEGNINEAITSVEAATAISPNNALLYFQLGLLRYNSKNFVGASGAFEGAVLINPVYANAKYFLGLAYYEIGRVSESIEQFEDVLTLNPSSKEVKFILENLKNGRKPFADAVPPIDEDPEKRDELPLDETPVEDLEDTEEVVEDTE